MASAENAEATLNGFNMLISRRWVAKSALSECGRSCQSATNSTREVNSSVHNRESGAVTAEQSVDFSTLKMSGSEYSETLSSCCKNAVTRSQTDLQFNILEDLKFCSTSGSPISIKKEWISIMLDKWSAFFLALVLFFLVKLLKYFDRLSRER